MSTLKLQILAQDIRTANYIDNHDCSIARAINRLGAERVFVVPDYAMFTLNNESYSVLITDLNDRVLAMDNYPKFDGEQPIDFEWETEINKSEKYGNSNTD